MTESRTGYALTIEMTVPFAEAVPRVTAALKEQGFGVLTEIDVRSTMREKIDAEVEDYLILGACNPPLAKRALDADREIGLLLPCNVVVRDGGAGRTIVQAMDPQVMVQVAGDHVADVATEARNRLRAALDSLG